MTGGRSRIAGALAALCGVVLLLLAFLPPDPADVVAAQEVITGLLVLLGAGICLASRRRID